MCPHHVVVRDVLRQDPEPPNQGRPNDGITSQRLQLLSVFGITKTGDVETPAHASGHRLCNPPKRRIRMDKYPRRILIGLLAGLAASIGLVATLNNSLLGVTLGVIIGV